MNDMAPPEVVTVATAVILTVEGDYCVRFIADPALKDSLGWKRFYRTLMAAAREKLQDNDLMFAHWIDGVEVGLGDDAPAWVQEIAGVSWEDSLNGRLQDDPYLTQWFSLNA